MVESTALEMRHTCKGIVGSNPTLSASFCDQHPDKGVNDKTSDFVLLNPINTRTRFCYQNHMDREKLIAARADRLRQARIAAGFKTLRAAAKKAEVTEDTYRAHEIGKNTFDADVALRYSKAFGVDLV